MKLNMKLITIKSEEDKDAEGYNVIYTYYYYQLTREITIVQLREEILKTDFLPGLGYAQYCNHDLNINHDQFYVYSDGTVTKQMDWGYKRMKSMNSFSSLKVKQVYYLKSSKGWGEWIIETY